MKTIGELAKDFRLAKGWTTTRMGKEVGTSRQSIENLEAAGDRQPRYIKDLASVMGTTVDKLMGASGEAHGSLTFTGQAYGEHYPPDRSGTAPVDRKPFSHFANTIAEMFDSLPDDPRVRAPVLGEITAAILRAQRQQESLPPTRPEPVQIPKTQSERHQ